MMISIEQAVLDGMKTAMKCKDTHALAALRALKTAIQNARIAKGSVSSSLDETELVALVRKLIKQGEDSIAMYDKAGRAELVEKEQKEIAVLAALLPADMSEQELARVLEEVIVALGASSKKDMRRVMKEMQARTAGRVAGKMLSQLVSARLS